MRKISVLFALFLAVSPLIVLLPAVEASVITVSSPTGNAIYNNNVLPMSVKVYSGETSGSSAIVYIEYVTSWQPNSTVSIWSWDPGFGRELMAQLANPRRTLQMPRNSYSKTVNLTEIPEGNNSVTIYIGILRYSSMSIEQGVFESYHRYANATWEFCNETVFFSVDTIPPKIVLESLDNETYTSADIALNCTVNEPVSNLTYSLDASLPVACAFFEVADNGSISVFGNTVLANLTNGEHNITFYATDKAGNAGASAPLSFIVKVPDPFPTSPAALAIAAVIVVGAGLLVYYHKTRRREAEPS